MAANRLLLCCGAMERPGWTRLDRDLGLHPDIAAVIPPLPEAVTKVEWQEIEWVHGITSGFDYWEGRALLAELYAVLAPGGKLVLEQPDIIKAMQRALADLLVEPQANGRLYWVFGNPAPHNPLHTNRWGYTPESLTAALVEAGFVRERIQLLRAQHHNPERDFRLEATK